MIDAIIEEKLTDPSSLAVILYQLCRKHSYNYEEQQVNRNESLRHRLRDMVINEAKEMAPHVTEEQWQRAYLRLHD